MKRYLSVLTSLLLATTAVEANDAVYYTTGNQLVPLNESDISIRKEILTITLSDNTRAKIDVYYEFENTSNTNKSVTMGFEADPPYDQAFEFKNNSKHPNIYDFTVELNGMPLTYQNAIYKVEEERSEPVDLSQWKPSEFGDQLVNRNDESKYVDYAYVYYFKADFAPGINKVHHTYSYDASNGVGFEYQIDYKLSPALRWANHQIDDFTLIIRADQTAKYFDVSNAPFGDGDPGWQIIEGMGRQRQSKIYDNLTSEFTLRNAAIEIHRQNFRPKGELAIFSADNKYEEMTMSVFGSYYSRSSLVQLFTGQDWETGEYLNEPKDPAKRKRIAHNLPFASRGHVFKNKEMKAYFEALWWYLPDPNYVDDPSKFNQTEQDYLKF